jgi:RimJ/RimL family protein N-acetyltransferase
MLYGNGVRLRFVEDSDRDYIVDLRNNSMQVENWFFSPDPFCLWKHDIFIEESRKKNDKFFVIEIPGDNWIKIGVVCVYNIDFIHRNCEFGRFIIDGGYNHKGYGKDTLNLIYKYCFDDLGMNKIYWEVLKNNINAIQFYEKVGCKIDGVKRQHIFKEGKFVDVLIMSILKEEYECP